jgi:DNA-damage-inducible protein J
MPANAVVRARIDEKTKKKAAAVLKTIGLTPSDAFRMMMIRIVREGTMPFDIHVPNGETIAASEAAPRSEEKTFHPVVGIFANLNSDD